jgi:hypothetical protein
MRLSRLLTGLVEFTLQILLGDLHRTQASLSMLKRDESLR